MGRAGIGGTGICGGEVKCLGLRLGLGPKVAPAGWGVMLTREKPRAKGEGGGMERSLVVDLRVGNASRGSTDIEARETPREGGRGSSAGSMFLAVDSALAGGTPFATSNKGIWCLFRANREDGGSK